MGPCIRDHKIRKDLKSERFYLSSTLFFTAALRQSASVPQENLSTGWHKLWTTTRVLCNEHEINSELGVLLPCEWCVTICKKIRCEDNMKLGEEPIKGFVNADSDAPVAFQLTRR
jgi:hypothetical protein